MSVAQMPGHVQEQHAHRQEGKRQADAAALWILEQRVPSSSALGCLPLPGMDQSESKFVAQTFLLVVNKMVRILNPFLATISCPKLGPV